MNYNVFITYGMGSYNLFSITEKHLEIIKRAWLNGDDSFTLSGQKYSCKHFNTFQIFENESGMSAAELESVKNNLGQGRGLVNKYFTKNQLENFGKNITDSVIGDFAYGSSPKIEQAAEMVVNHLYINPKRIEEFNSLNGKISYDLSKLIKLCKEINDNYEKENYYSVALLLRTVLNHIPPAFNGKDSFEQVLAELNGKKHQTKKEVFLRLQELQRRLADLVAHEKLRSTEPIIVAQNVQFIPEIDFLLSEAYYELKVNSSLAR